MSDAPAPSRRRGGGRAPSSTGPSLAPIPRLENHWAPLEVLSAEQIERILAAAYRILEEAGLEIRSAGAREIFRRGGASVDEATQIVRLGREVVQAHLSTRAGALRAACPQPAAPPARWRQGGQLRPRQRRPQHSRRGGWPALRGHRGLPQYPQAHPYPWGPALAGRHRGRAGGRAGGHATPGGLPGAHRVLGHRLGGARRRAVCRPAMRSRCRPSSMAARSRTWHSARHS